ncbi:MAG: hypothetical protein JWR16_723 [Nevskia sp.]|nr:hypothetical protein [Nevskia sp.]
MSRSEFVLALAGGVGGAKLAAGLAEVLPPEALTLVVNTGDDFRLHGLHISPDLDSVMYALAGLHDPVRGWGLAGESWAFMQAFRRLGGEDWFQLGDQDLATHLLRTQLLHDVSLTEVTATLCARLGLRHRIVPMTDDPVGTRVLTDEGLLQFQDYFVRRRAQPVLRRVMFDGVESARPSAGLIAALQHPQLSAILICPSNPVLSIAPILALPGVRAQLQDRRVPVVAVSPIIGSRAVKGPAAKILGELALPVSALGIAHYYDGLLDGLLIDSSDEALCTSIRGPRIRTAPILMHELADKRALALTVLDFARELHR